MPFILIPITIVVLGILGIAHALVYGAIVTIFAMLSSVTSTIPAILILRIIFVVLALSFTVATFISFASGGILERIFYKISAVWTGFLMYFFFAAFAYGALVYVDGFDGFAHAVLFSKLGIAFFAIAFLVGLYGLIHANTLLVTKVSVRLPNLPSEWRGRRAVWISDIHLGHIHGAHFLKKVVRKIGALSPSPDLIFIGGDLFDGVKVDANAVIEPLRDLRATHGVYFIMGNHEEFSEKNAGVFLQVVKNLPNIRVLEDEVVTIDGVDIIGVDHGHTDTPAKFAEVLARLKFGTSARPSILLKHEPRDLDVAVLAGISLQISGHTHRGQVFPATLLAELVFPGFNYGLHERSAKDDSGEGSIKKMLVYTSSGVGTWGPPLRVGTRSEVVLFEFE